MSATGRAAQVAALRGMPKDKGRGIRLGGLGVRVHAGRVIVMGRDKGPVAGACAGAVRPGGRYGHTTAFVQFADGSKPQERYVQWGMEQGIGQEIRWFNYLVDQATADPRPSIPAQGRLTGMPLIQLAADSQKRAAGQASAPVPKPAAAKPLIKPATVGGEVLSLRWTETLLRIAILERRIYRGKVVSRDAREAVASQRRTAAAPPPAARPLATKAPARPARATSGSHQVAAVAVASVMFLVIATVLSGVIDGIVVFVHYNVTIPSRCGPGPEPGICSTASLVQSCAWVAGIIYGLVFLIGIPAIVKQGMSGKKAA